jgi:hypothetical protein
MSGSRLQQGSKWSMQVVTQRSSLHPAERMHGTFRAAAQSSAHWNGLQADRGLFSFLSSLSLVTRAKDQILRVQQRPAELEMKWFAL